MFKGVLRWLIAGLAAALALVIAFGIGSNRHAASAVSCRISHENPIRMRSLGTMFVRPSHDLAGSFRVHQWVAAECTGTSNPRDPYAVARSASYYEDIRILAPDRNPQPYSTQDDSSVYTLDVTAVVNGAAARPAHGQPREPPVPSLRIDGHRQPVGLTNYGRYRTGLTTAPVRCPSLPHLHRLTVQVAAISPQGMRFSIAEVLDNSHGTCGQ